MVETSLLQVAPDNFAYMIVNGIDLGQVVKEIEAVMSGKIYDKCEIKPESTKRIFFVYKDILGLLTIFFLCDKDKSKMIKIDISCHKGGDDHK